LLKIAHKLKRYIWQKLKQKKNQNLNKATIDNQVSSSRPKVGTIVVTIDNHMVITQIQIGKNIIKDVFMDGGFGVNIIVERTIELRLGLPKLKPAPYNLKMVDQITIKLVGLIRDMKIFTTFPT
jgi:hypothetical protein